MFLFITLIVIITLIAAVMILLVLVQSGKGGGLAGIASGGATTQILGARQAPDVLEKATWVLATVFIVLCILTNFAVDRGDQRQSIIQEQAQGQSTTPPAAEPAPAESAPAQQAPAQQPAPPPGQ